MDDASTIEASLVPNPGQQTVSAANKRPQARTPVSKYAMASLRMPEDKEVGKLADSMLSDPIVQIADYALRAYIRDAETTVTITGGALRGQVLQHALQNLWQNHIQEMLYCIRHGRSAFEKSEKYSRDQNLTYIDELIYLEYEHSELKISKDGKYEGITLRKTTIDAKDSWWLALNPTAKNPYGKSHYIGAPSKVWRQRQTLDCLREDAAIRFVIDGGVWAVPMDTEIEDGQVVDDASAFAAAMDAKRTGGVTLLPNKTIRGVNGDSVDAYRLLAEPVVRDLAPLSAEVAVKNTELLLACGVPPATVLESEVGSFAKASIQVTVLYAVCEMILSQIERSFRKFVAIPNMSQNFQSGEVSCTVTHVPLSRKNQVQAGQTANMPYQDPMLQDEKAARENPDEYDENNMPREPMGNFGQNQNGNRRFPLTKSGNSLKFG